MREVLDEGRHVSPEAAKGERVSVQGVRTDCKMLARCLHVCISNPHWEVWLCRSCEIGASYLIMAAEAVQTHGICEPPDLTLMALSRVKRPASVGMP